MTRDNLLKWLLRLIGGVELLAIPFVFIPFSWMQAIHARLPEMEALLHAPALEYLARGLSAMYALHGAVVVFVSTDVVRFRPLIRFLGVAHLLFGLVMFGVSVAAALPLWWVLGEGPVIVTGGVLTLFLSRERRGA